VGKRRDHRAHSYARLGLAIREARLERGLSQEELAARSDTDRSYMGGVERGERRPSYGKMLDVAQGLGMAGAELVARAEALGVLAGEGDGRQTGSRPGS
jgi:transcriptional regulator with XRE-family HTH domain